MKTSWTASFGQWFAALLGTAHKPRTSALQTAECPRQIAPHPTPRSNCEATLRQSPARVPVRVIRVSEAGVPQHSAGRMVISGRFADVCAELDRIATLAH
jgi:hypothetical protein